ncbi:MAG: hypothetical protein FJ299_03170 [Planctomycetes bacterium]|nr:hypothetical protein [Planctomycetota bacterium]
MRSRSLPLVLGLAACSVIAACGEGFIVASFDLVITSPTTEATYATSDDEVSLSGTLEYTLGIHEDLDVDWQNLSTGTSGGGTVNASLSTWNAGPIPLQVGSNVIRVEFEADGGWDDTAQLTVEYTPVPLQPALPPLRPDADPAAHTLVVPAGAGPDGAPPAAKPRVVELNGAR